MNQRKVIQLFSMQPPLRHGLIHQRREAIVVLALQQMDQLVHDDIFEADRWFFDQFEVEPDALCLDVARAPARLHLFDAPLGDVNAKDGFPLGDERRNEQFELLSIPREQHTFTLSNIAAGAHHQIEAGVVTDGDMRRASLIDDIEAIAVTLKVVAFAGDVFPRRLALLPFKLGLLTFDPGEFGNHGEAHGFIVDAQRRSDAHPAIGWIDSEVQVLDVLANHLHGEAMNGDLMGLSIQLDSSPVQRCARLRRHLKRAGG